MIVHRCLDAGDERLLEEIDPSVRSADGFDDEHEASNDYVVLTDLDDPVVQRGQQTADFDVQQRIIAGCSEQVGDTSPSGCI